MPPRSHVGIIWPAATFWRHPVDILVGVLDIARFAMDAVLGVDLVTRVFAFFFNPFIDAGGAIARRRPCKLHELATLLQIHVLDLQMDRLIFSVVGV